MDYKHDVFISYRVDLDAQAAQELATALEAEDYDCYLDRDDLDYGSWHDQLRTALDRSRIVCVLISSGWVDYRRPDNPRGRRCLDDPKDVVREEVSRALERHRQGLLTVVPVLLDRASLPSKRDDLDEAISGLFDMELQAGFWDATRKLPQLVEKLSGYIQRVGQRPVDDSSKAAPTVEETPSVELPPPDAELFARPVGAYDGEEGLTSIRLEGDRLAVEGGGASRQVDFAASSGVLSANGRLVLIGGNGVLQAGIVGRSSIKLLDPVDVDAPAKPLAIWEVGDFVRIAHAGSADLTQISQEFGDRTAWVPPAELGERTTWTHFVHNDRAYASVSTDGVLRVCGSLGDAVAGHPHEGWVGIDLIESTTSPGHAWVAAVRHNGDGTHLIVAQRADGRWTPRPPIAIPSATSVMLPRSAPMVDEPMVLLEVDAQVRGWRLSHLAPGAAHPT